MRMWMVNPRILCRKHLLGNHVEDHMFLGHLKLKRKVDGYIKNNLLEPLNLKKDHDQLVIEMLRRGYNHNTPLTYEPQILKYLGEEYLNHRIDLNASLCELLSRCNDCKARYIKLMEENINV